jgi:hypothetical protein
MLNPTDSISLALPILTAAKFSEFVGLDVGVVDAQLDRRILPCLRIGKRRFVNIEALRIAAAKKGEEFTL